MAVMAYAAAADLLAAVLLRQAAAGLKAGSERSLHMATAYLCCAAAALLAGATSPHASLHNALLLGAVAAALTPGGGLLSALLVAAGGADWPPGAVLLAVPLAMLAARTSIATSRSSSSSSRGAPARPPLKLLLAYCAFAAATLAALLHLPHLLPPHQAALVDGWLGRAAWPPTVPTWHGSGALPSASLDWVGARAGQPSPFQHASPLLPAASLQPGLGLHWYLLAQVFPRFRAFFLYSLQALPSATMLPLALRFPHQPELLLAAGALLRCLLHPAPRPAMAAMWVGLLPLAGRPLEGIRSRLPWLGLGMAAALLLSKSAMQLWLEGGGGNANFLYGMTLLWGGLQTLLLLQLLRSAARQEGGGRTGGAGEGAAVQAAGGSGQKDD